MFNTMCGNLCPAVIPNAPSFNLPKLDLTMPYPGNTVMNVDQETSAVAKFAFGAGVFAGAAVTAKALKNIVQNQNGSRLQNAALAVVGAGVVVTSTIGFIKA